MQPKRTMREILDSYGISTAPPDDPIYTDGFLVVIGGDDRGEGGEGDDEPQVGHGDQTSP